MPYKPITHDEAVPIYRSRLDLDADSFTRTRIRVAIQIVGIEYKNRPLGQSKQNFCIWLLKWLDKQRQVSKPHPLTWEITRCAKDIMEGKSAAQTYAEVLKVSGSRALHKAKYGGKKEAIW